VQERLRVALKQNQANDFWRIVAVSCLVLIMALVLLAIINVPYEQPS